MSRPRSVAVWLKTKILSHSSFFTGGVFLGAGLLHMLPDASHELSSHYAFPVVFLTASLGFLLIYSLDKINFSDHQLDNAQLVSMAVSKSGGKICYVSVRPVVLSYGSFRNNRQDVVRRVQDAAQQMVQDGGVALLPQQLEDGQTAGFAEGEGSGHALLGAMRDSMDESTPIAVYPAVTIVHVRDGEQPEEETKVQPQVAEGSGREEGHVAGKSKDNQQRGNKSSSHSRVSSSSQRSEPEHSSCKHSHHHTNGASSTPNNRFSVKHTSRPASTPHNTSAAAPLLDSSEHSVENTTWPYPSTTSVKPGADDGDDHEHEELHHHHINIPHHALLPIFLAIVFSVHSLIEGLALGAQPAVSSSAISILVAIASHKVVEAVSVGANFIKQGVAASTALPVLLVYTLMTPLGVVAGWAVEWGMARGDGGGGGGDGESGDDGGGKGRGGVSWVVMFQSLLQAFAAGSFLYLAVHEISDEKCCAAVKRTYQVLLMVAGLGVMALLAVWA